MASRENNGLAGKDEMKNKYKVLLCDVMSNSTVHGLPNIRRAKSMPKRLFWSISFLTAVGMFVGFSSGLIMKYYEYEVNVGVQVNFQRNLTFPAITICNLNPLRKSFLRETHSARLRKIVERAANTTIYDIKATPDKVTNGTVNNSNNQQSSDYSHWDDIDGTFYRNPSPQWLMDKQVTEYLTGIEVPLRREIGHQLGDLLISCQWNNFQCSPSNFTYLMNTYYGNCYTFNSGTGSPALSTNFAGSTHGLTLELFVEQDEYLDSVTQSAGVRVTIHSQDETPFPEDNGFNIEPGKLTSVGITMGKTVRLPHPFTDCVSADTTEHEIAFKNSYSVEACMKSCLLTHIAEACNCTDGRYPKPDDYEDVGHCQYQNEEQRQCVSSADMLYEANRLACDCPSKCLTVSYAKETSSAVWPSSNSEDYVRGTLRSRSSKLRLLIEEQERTGQDLLGKNVLKLAVYFRDLTHQAISQSQLYTKMSLVSDIGGNLGLWIGLSVLTIMEFVELIFDMSAILGVLCSAKGKRTEMTGESERRVRQDGQFYKNPEQGVTYRNGDVYYTKGRNYDGDNERQYNGIFSAHRDIYLPNGVI